MTPKIAERLQGERKVIHFLLTEAKNNGWAFAVDDGEELHKTDNIDAALDAVFSVDESHIDFRKGTRPCWVFIVLGNSPAEVINDYGINLAFDAEVMVKVNAYMDTLQ